MCIVKQEPQQQKPQKPAWKIVVSSLLIANSYCFEALIGGADLFTAFSQPTSPDKSQSAVALSETGTAVAWPSLGAAKESSREKAFGFGSHNARCSTGGRSSCLPVCAGFTENLCMQHFSHASIRIVFTLDQAVVKPF